MSTEYPRPDFSRPNKNWELLNGDWDFVFDDDDVGLLEKWHAQGLLGTNIKHQEVSKSTPSHSEVRKIEVPFVFQSRASGINEQEPHEVLWYERTISDIRTEQDISQDYRLVLRFGAVDYEATVWVDGQFMGNHRGGHVPFEVDISDAMAKEAKRLTVRVRDSPYDLTQPRGKQYWAAKPENIFYTPSSGIWQSVWLESVPYARIGDSSYGTVLRSDDVQNGVLHSTIAVRNRRAGQRYTIEMQANIGGYFVGKSRKSLPKDKDCVRLDLDMKITTEQQSNLSESMQTKIPFDDKNCWIDGLALWSPEHPTLYTLYIRLSDSSGDVIDEVKTYTGMRSLDWQAGNSTFKLNGKAIFQALILDQGYWPDTGMTPPSNASCKTDIELAKKMGFNGCRKHQKVEDPVFLHWADTLGFLVWGEMANAYQFDSQYVQRFDQEWIEAVKRDINHPSIITWTPVNESWGYTSLGDDTEQRNHLRSLYYATKIVDPTRSINDNCGWEHVCTDLTTFHDYSDGPQLTEVCAKLPSILDQKSGRDIFVPKISRDDGARHSPGAPVLCTEFGGVNIAPARGEEGRESDWGYTTASDPEDLLKRVRTLVLGVVRGGHCCGFVYTQLTDIEQEVNGLYSFDRKAKLDSSKVKAIMDEAKEIYYQGLRTAEQARTASGTDPI